MRCFFFAGEILIGGLRRLCGIANRLLMIGKLRSVCENWKFMNFSVCMCVSDEFVWLLNWLTFLSFCVVSVCRMCGCWGRLGVCV